jgi:hypothetical protein
LSYQNKTIILKRLNNQLMKGFFLSIAMSFGSLLSAQTKPMTVRFLPTFSTGKVVSSGTNASVGNANYSKTKEKSSKTVKTKNVMRFGDYTVSDVSFKEEAVETSASYFLKYVNSKIESSSAFTVNAGPKHATVKTAENVAVEGGASAAWTDLLIPFKARLVSTGMIQIDSTHWEYLVEDKNFINNSQEETVGFLTNNAIKITIKLHKRVLSFYDADKKIGELKFPIFKDSTIWLAESLDADTKLAISAISSAALFKVRGTNTMD